jgi:opacity protein-like surface antigen
MNCMTTRSGTPGAFGKGRMASALVAGMLALGAGTVATPQTTAAQAGGWQFELTPYIWAAGMSGDVQGGALPTIGVDMSFSDILDNLDAGLMGAFEARKGRWGFLFDAIYMKLKDSGTASRTGTGPIGATATASAELEVKQTLFAAAVAYRAVEGRAPLDVIGGLRYSKIEADASINGSFFAQTGTVARSAEKDWVDPYIGVRVLQPIASHWTLVGYLDIGGFGVGSDFTWQTLLGVNYEFSKMFAGKFGYRYISVDYDKDGFVYDMANSGLYLGLGIRF